MSQDVWALLERAWDEVPDEFDYCLVRWNGDQGDLYAAQPGEPIVSLMFNHAGPGIYDLMYELARTGDMVILPVGVAPCHVREDQREHLPPNLADGAIVVHSGHDLLRTIETAET